MTLAEWARVEALIAAAWSQARVMDEAQVRMRFGFVRDVPLAAALDAVERMARTGREWPPTPGQIAAAIRARELGPPPSVGEVIELLCRAARRYGRRQEADALRWLAGESKHAARFAVEHGWRQWCAERLDDPRVGGAVRQRLEKSLASSIDGFERELLSGDVLPLVGRRLDALGGGSRGAGLRRIGPGAAGMLARPDA